MKKRPVRLKEKEERAIGLAVTLVAALSMLIVMVSYVSIVVIDTNNFLGKPALVPTSGQHQLCINF